MMKHKTLSILLAMFMSMVACVASAHDFVADGIYYNITSSTELNVSVTFRGDKSSSYSNEYTGSVVIPETVTYSGKTYSVTSIGNSAFSGCSGLTSVTIPNSVTSIGSWAFDGCSGLTSVNIPNSVTSIGNSAFEDCSGLTSVTIPNSVTSIGNSAFRGCSGLTSVTIPNSVTSIGNSAFYGCSSLTSVTIPNSVTSIGWYAFSGCSGLTSVTIPNSVTSIGDGPFGSCSGLTSIIVEDGNSKYDSRDGCNAIIESSSNTLVAGCKNTAIPSSVTSIGDEAFNGCSDLTSVTIPNSVTSIGIYAFYGCSGLTKAEFASVESLCNIKFGHSISNPLYYAHHLYINGEEVKDLVIPNSVTSIGSYAFYGCSGLTSVTIPNSVTSIGGSAFEGCSGLTSVTINSNAIASKSYSSSSTLSGIFGSQVKEYVFGDGVKSIGSYACYNCTNMTSVTIPNSVTSIGSDAFSGCSGLTSVTIPNSVTSIGDYAFRGCSDLTSVTINSNAIAAKAYSSSQTLSGIFGLQVKEYVFGDEVGSVGSYACYNCKNLTSVTIPNSVTSIGEGAFYGCSSLTRAAFACVESLCNIKFSNYASNPLYYAHHLYINGEEVKDLVISNSVTSIGDYVFYGCSGLTSVTIPSSVTEIGSSAFYGCGGLTSVTIPNSVTSIGRYAFSGCSGLTSVTIPNSVTSIGDYAFSGCSGLTSVTIPESVTSIGTYAFADCIGLNTVTSCIDIPFNLNSSVFTYTNTSYNPNTIYYIATLIVPKGRKMLYSMAEGWKLFANIQELDLTGLDSVQSDVQTDHKKWVRLDGTEVQTNLKRSGIYIHNGKKVLVK